MRQFKWKACNKKGEVFTGKMVANNVTEVALFLKSQYGYVLSVSQLSTHFNLTKLLLAQKLSSKDSEMFFRQIAVLLNSGLTLIRALGIIKEKVKEFLKRVCDFIEKDLLKGLSFSKALGKFPEYFSLSTRQIIAAGEISGNLSILLMQLADIFKQEDETLKQIKNACIYPAFILLSCFVSISFLTFKVFPILLDIYTSLDLKKNIIFTYFIWMNNLLQEYAFESLLMIMAFSGLLYKHRKLLFKCIIKFPGINSCYKSISEVRYCKILGLMLKSGISLPLALFSAGETLSSTTMQIQAKEISEKVLRGIPLSDSVTSHQGFLSTTTKEFISVGENCGLLSEMLLEAADSINAEVQDKIKNLQASLQPLLIMSAAILVGMLLVAVTSPLFGLVMALPSTS